MSEPKKTQHPLSRLSEPDLELVLRFVLASGSLKKLATSYGVSYPTIRARLDELIARLEALTSERELDPMIDLLADLVSEGEMTPRAARRLRELHRKLAQEK